MEVYGETEWVEEGEITSFDSSADLCCFTAYEKLQAEWTDFWSRVN